GVVIVEAEQQYSIEPFPGDPSFKHLLRPISDHRNITCEMQDTPPGTSTNHKTGRMLLSMGDPQPGQEEPAPPPPAGGSSNQVSAERRAEPGTPDSNFIGNLIHPPPLCVFQGGGTGETKYVELVLVADNSEVGVVLRWLRLMTASPPPPPYLPSLPSSQYDLYHRDLATLHSRSLEIANRMDADHSVSILAVASTVAHQLGHNLGLNHITADEKCGQPSTGKQWIMEQGTKAGYMPGLEFSSCSRMELAAIFREGGGKCLFNVPAPSSVFGKAQCGNLVVEKGEQCDCGLTQECADPCCNASTCQLVAGAECASDGLCCEQCKINPAGTLCREPLGDCDLPEYCTGASPHCPDNTYLQDGETCARGQAHCYGGECRTLQSQCQSVWGPGSSPAPEACFRKVNMRGDRFGSCGRRLNGTYLPCSPRVTETRSQLRPQRPPPPHWTQSTELQVMSARN
ncbi:hypothetical protein AB205_0120870, partial [Aquarana catesbeiana]